MIIPKGAYCYDPKIWSRGADGKLVKTIETCIYWEEREESCAYCNLLQEGDCILLAAKNKICGINESATGG
jgi:hypothetical protein